MIALKGPVGGPFQARARTCTVASQAGLHVRVLVQGMPRRRGSLSSYGLGRFKPRLGKRSDEVEYDPEGDARGDCAHAQ